MNIEYVNHGIGNNFGDTIELNENLKKYPNLHRAILDHELKHSNKTFTKEDLMLDLTERKVSFFELLKFMTHNPKSFSQFLPVYWTKKHGLVYDINLILIYAVLSFLAIIGIYIGVNLA